MAYSNSEADCEIVEVEDFSIGDDVYNLSKIAKTVADKLKRGVPVKLETRTKIAWNRDWSTRGNGLIAVVDNLLKGTGVKSFSAGSRDCKGMVYYPAY
jgi:hypothetical protein